MAEDLFAKLGGMPGMKGMKFVKPGAYNKGDTVVLHGLQAKPELNECHGTVLGDEKDGRYPVKISKEVSLKVKPANLKRPPAPAEDAKTKEQRDRMPLPWNLGGGLKFVADNTIVDTVRLECFKSLYEHAGSAEPEHQKNLAAEGMSQTMVGIIRDASSSEAIRCAACGTLQNYATHIENVPEILKHGSVGALAGVVGLASTSPTVTPEQSAVTRETAALALNNISNHEKGKLAVGSHACGELVRLANDPMACGTAHEVAMSVLGSLLYHQECWAHLVQSGAVLAAVSLLRRPDCTPKCSESAAGLLYVLALTTREVRDAIREAKGLEVLHKLASEPRATDKARQTARQAMEIFAKRHGEVVGTDKHGAAAFDVS